jgi:CHASE2 domain-containing sensor protein
MVRERVGDWRSIWRFALAGLLASTLVVATSQTTVIEPLYFALQDQLFPAPPPSSQVTLVALDSSSSLPFGPFPWTNDVHAKVINYLASLHPRVILFDVMLDHSLQRSRDRRRARHRDCQRRQRGADLHRRRPSAARFRESGHLGRSPRPWRA